MGTRRRNHPKIIVVLGPTASGKSDLAVKIAKKFKGEIVSADSRQVYRGMDIGTGKVENESSKKDVFIHQGIIHHCIDIASPKRRFSVAQYQKAAQKSINDILKREKLPILCGGTAFYIKALVEGISLPEALPDWSLRKELNKKNKQELYSMLRNLDPERAKNIEKDNPRRLIRALEIVIQTDKPVPEIKKNYQYNPLFIGTKIDREKLNKRIEKRLDERLKQGMIDEVDKLRGSGLSWQRIKSFGLEYKWLAKYLQKEISYQEMHESLLRDIIKFSKNQMAWWKNDPGIEWIEKNQDALNLVKNFIKK